MIAKYTLVALLQRYLGSHVVKLIDGQFGLRCECPLCLETRRTLDQLPLSWGSHGR